MTEYYEHRCKCGCGEFIKIQLHHKEYGIPKYIRGHNCPMDDPEARRKVSETMKGKDEYGPKSSKWKGGSYGYWHEKAWKLFGKSYCELCGMTLEETFCKYERRFDMHNMLDPKNYLIMEADAWICLCRKCHVILEDLSKGITY